MAVWDLLTRGLTWCLLALVEWRQLNSCERRGEETYGVINYPLHWDEYS